MRLDENNRETKHKQAQKQRLLKSILPHPHPPSLLLRNDIWNGNRFCSLSWYDRQLVENSRSAPKIGLNASKDSGDGEQSLLAVSQGGDAVGTGEASAGWKESGAGSAGAESGDSGGSSPPAGLCGVDGGGFGVGFGSRARPGEASVMATLKARSERPGRRRKNGAGI